MRYGYTIYPEAQALLDSSGLTARVKKAHKDYKISLRGMVYQEEVVGHVKGMQKEGLFNKIPKQELTEFQKKINAAFKEPEKNPYIIKTHSETIKESADPEDVLNIVGWEAAHFLRQEELFDYKSFGFRNLSAFTGSLGALINGELHNHSDKRSYKWQSTSNQQDFITEISGDHNGDFRLFRTDITPYPTIDPLGNEVQYRPELYSDKRCVAASCSIETSLLAAIIKYAEQEKIPSEILRNHQDFIRDMKKGDSFLGNFADAGDWSMITPRFLFICHDLDISKINTEGMANEKSHRRIPCYAHSGGYTIFVGSNKELIFSYREEKSTAEKGKKVDISLSIPARELDHLFRGLFQQAKMGLGRTSLMQLVQTMEYYFSEQFKIDQAKNKTISSQEK